MLKQHLHEQEEEQKTKRRLPPLLFLIVLIIVVGGGALLGWQLLSQQGSNANGSASVDPAAQATHREREQAHRRREPHRVWQLLSDSKLLWSFISR